MTLRDDILRIRADIEDSFMPDYATSARTTLRVRCRVAAGQGYVRLRDLPSYMRMQEWKLVLPATTDVQIGDRFAVTGGVTGTYLVITTRDPTSYTPYNACNCVKVDDTGTFPAIGTQTATFRSRASDTDTITGVEVYLRPEFRAPSPGESSYSFDYLVTWNDTVTFADGRKPGQDDIIVCAALDAPGTKAILSQPARSSVPRPTASAVLRLVR